MWIEVVLLGYSLMTGLCVATGKKGGRNKKNHRLVGKLHEGNVVAQQIFIFWKWKKSSTAYFTMEDNQHISSQYGILWQIAPVCCIWLIYETWTFACLKNE